MPGIGLPDDFRSFLQISDGLLLRWSVNWNGGVVPLGCMRLNALDELEEVRVERAPFDADVEDEDEVMLVSDAYPTAIVPKRSVRYRAFSLDNECADGRICLCFGENASAPEVWFYDLSCHWYFIARTFTDYFRLMVMHLGLPHWQYAFTDVGLDLVTKQWFAFLSPERLAIDEEHHSQRTQGRLADPVRAADDARLAAPLGSSATGAAAAGLAAASASAATGASAPASAAPAAPSGARAASGKSSRGSSATRAAPGAGRLSSSSSTLAPPSSSASGSGAAAGAASGSTSARAASGRPVSAGRRLSSADQTLAAAASSLLSQPARH